MAKKAVKTKKARTTKKKVVKAKKKAKRYAIPRVTKPITAGQLLRKIQELVLAKPTRLNMNAWLFRYRGKLRREFVGRNIPNPSCGTVACIAGWGAVLLRPAGVSADRLDQNASLAMKWAVGHEKYSDTRYADDLFSAGPVRSLGEYNWGLPTPGTQEHAEVVAKRIDTYLQLHPELETRPVDVPAVQNILRQGHGR
jgi:hypothetical protein